MNTLYRRLPAHPKRGSISGKAMGFLAVAVVCVCALLTLESGESDSTAQPELRFLAGHAARSTVRAALSSFTRAERTLPAHPSAGHADADRFRSLAAAFSAGSSGRLPVYQDENGEMTARVVSLEIDPPGPGSPDTAIALVSCEAEATPTSRTSDETKTRCRLQVWLHRGDRDGVAATDRNSSVEPRVKAVDYSQTTPADAK